MLCNYCQMKSIEQRASRAGSVVVKQEGSGPSSFPGGVRVLVKPRGEVLDQEKHFTVWFARLPTTCCC